MATIAENLQTIIDIKADIKTAIENKGVTVGDASFSEYAGKINSIVGSGTAAWALPDGTKFANSTATTFPELHFNNLTETYGMFQDCENLTSVPLFNTSNVTNMNGMFYGCKNLTSVPLFDTSSTIGMRSMFSGCTLIESIPQFDTSKVQSIMYFCDNCTNLTTIPLLDFSSVNCFTVGFSECTSLTNLGGFTEFGLQGRGVIGTVFWLIFEDCPNLTRDSVLNVFNTVHNMKSDELIEEIGHKITLNTNTYALLSSSDIAIATAKGWIVESK